MTEYYTSDSWDSREADFPKLDRPLPCDFCGQPRYEDSRGGCSACGAPLGSFGPSPVEQIYRFGKTFPVSDE